MLLTLLIAVIVTSGLLTFFVYSLMPWTIRYQQCIGSRLHRPYQALSAFLQWCYFNVRWLCLPYAVRKCYLPCADRTRTYGV